jgi:tetratricopeptide (TPR) repeat protein
MRVGAQRGRIAVVVLLLLLIGVAAYPIGLHLWGRYHADAAQEALERRDFLEASNHLKECLEVWPHDVTIRLLAAQTSRRQGNYEEAFQHWRAYVQDNGPLEPLLLERSLLRLQVGDLTESDRFLETCLDHSEGAEMPLLLEAVIEGNLRALARKDQLPGSPVERSIRASQPVPDVSRVQRAVDLWLRHRHSQVEQARGLTWRGQAHQLVNDYALAVADFRQALELEPDHFQARLWLAAALAQAAPLETLAHLQRLQRRYPENYEVRLWLGNVCRNLGQLAEARQPLDEILASNPNDVRALVELALVELDARQPEKAERWLRQALDLAPNQYEVNLALGRCLHLEGRAAEAKHYQDRAREIETAPRNQAKESRKHESAAGG